MSYIEFIGTVSGLASVWLATKSNIHTWTIGLLNVVAFFIIYYQIQLYSDMFLQVFFFGTSVLGIWQWLKKKPVNNDKKIRLVTSTYRIALGAGIVLSALLWGYFMTNIHLYFKSWFPEPAAYPYADALTTVLSIFATFLMAYKRLECWVLWILVDIICVFLYYKKGVMFISLEYFVFLIIASIGLFQWIKMYSDAQRSSTR